MLAAVSIMAQVKFETSLSQSKVSLGERVKITYNLNSSGKSFRGPQLRDLQILSGPNQSQSSQWINGKSTTSISFSYIVVPTKTGKITIPGASIRSGGKNLTSNAVVLQVIKGSNSRTQSNGNNRTKQDQKQPGNEVNDNLFIKLYIDKKDVFIGEQITATYQIYTRVNIVNNGINKLPAYNGFFAEEVELKDNGQLQRTNVNGVPFNMATIKRSILIPQRAGKLEIDPLILDVVVRVKDNKQTRSVFDQFFGSYKDVKYKIASNKAIISVSSLPTKGKPASYVGAVGSFKQKVTIDKDSVQTNDAINLKILFKGNGNIKLIQEPKIQFPPDFEVYDPKVNQNISTSGSTVSGTKSYEYLVIPRHSGTFKIPSIEFSFFNPQTKKYETQKSKEFKIKVGRSAGDEANSVYNPIKKEDIKFLGQDIRFINENKMKLQNKGSYFLFSSFYFLILLLPLMGVFTFLWMANKKRLTRSEQLSKRSKKAIKLAMKKLKDARLALKEGNKSKFFEQLLIGLNSYFSDKFSIPVSELNINEIKSRLEKLGYSSDVIKETADIVGLCEMARYAPTTVSSEQELLTRSENLIKKIEAHG